MINIYFLNLLIFDIITDTLTKGEMIAAPRMTFGEGGLGPGRANMQFLTKK